MSNFTPKPWWKVVDDQMAANEPQRLNRRSMAINYPHDMYSIVARAAEKRGMSMTAYQRRAVMAIACFDLGVDWLTVMQSEPAIGTAVNPGSGVKRDGLGFGAWEVEGLRDSEVPDE